MDEEQTVTNPTSTWARFRGPLHSLVAAATVLAIVVAIPYALLWFLFWVVSGSWDFEGSSGPRYWLLAKGSRLDRLGFVAATPRPAS